MELNEPKQIIAIPASIGKEPAKLHLSFFGRIRDHVQTFIVEKLDERSRRVQTVFNDFIEAYAEEETLHKREQGSEYLPLIAEAEQKCRQYVNGIYAGLSYYYYIGTDAEKQAANKMLEKWAKNKLSTQEYQGERLRQFIEDVEQEADLILAVNTLRLGEHTARLKATNLSCISLINQCNNERKEIDKETMDNARKLTESTYRDMAQTINSFAVVTFDGISGPYDEAIDIINADIEYYKNNSKTNPEPVGSSVPAPAEEPEETFAEPDDDKFPENDGETVDSTTVAE